MTEKEKLVSAMSEARVIAAADNVIIPMIELRIKNKLQEACGKFRTGKTDFLPEIAYIAAMDDIKTELIAKDNKGKAAHRKLNKENL